ncbi:hypothetical protein PTSG_12060 [Salpingoeca rosetta]|uniref:SWIM-type domain-containing protein n=1 Tax=Salpingoeca rosetta (strain ATCC 50818 / BSB-021) TaxID=946362 RepID=F2U6C1_SALR5|nr:uncharacterized protein PTSG_12060 [Salpingoeca rosetta]EGD83062.1 hypothetical protein PTSG_12060 [Salpingoeca rosetta]|eukprot:XP_004995426.1 hypothetical protein PTSG_12060 [Salpingoeca rosetta]
MQRELEEHVLQLICKEVAVGHEPRQQQQQQQPQQSQQHQSQQHQSQQQRELSSEMLAALHSVFPQNALAALDILDRRAVTEITCPAGRVAHQVAGKGGRVYFTLVDQGFCECAAYEYTVLRNEVSMCKHVLAVRLARATNLLQHERISDAAFAARMNPSAPP